MTQRLGEILSELGKGNAAGAVIRQIFELQSCQDVLKNVLQEKHGIVCEAVKLNNGILTVAVDNSVSAQEITFRRNVILAEIARRFGNKKVMDIKVSAIGRIL